MFSPLIVAILENSAALPFVRISYSASVIYLIGGLVCAGEKASGWRLDLNLLDFSHLFVPLRIIYRKFKYLFNIDMHGMTSQGTQHPETISSDTKYTAAETR